MRKLMTAAFTLGFVAAAPAALWAQEHPEAAHPPAAARPAPMAVHAPAASFHAPTSHPVISHHVSTHHVSTHRVSTHRISTHHVIYHTHHVIHHYRHATIHHVTHPAVTRAVVHGRPNVAALRRNVTAVRRFHAGIYRAPPGYHYRRWSFGQVLPAIYFGRQFWITDWLAFGLFGPPDGYVWVRYGPDALLIDEYTGEIIQVDYGVFY